MGSVYKVHGVQVELVSELNSGEYDAVVVVTSPGAPLPQALEDFITAAVQLDKALETRCGLVRCERVAGARLVLAPTGSLTPYHDVRSVYEAAGAGTARALAAGARRPVLALAPHERWPRAPLVALLGALQQLYVPLQARELGVGPAADALGVYGEGLHVSLPVLLRDAVALELARGIARDIGGADQERMTPLAVAQYVREQFAGEQRVVIRVLDDADTIRREYPLLAAVSRAADTVDRHRGCVVFLEYVPDEYEETLMFVGKGVTYDTGGCDIKTDGAMAGMSRDKCGAAAVAGFVKACASLEARVKLVCALALVRNSVGEEAYAADEVLRSRRGDTVRVGNTDAEGRLAMADLLAEMAERAGAERGPRVYSVATLTGHAHRTAGDGYTIAMDNHVARAQRHAERLSESGESVAEPAEVSVLRREDFAAHRGRAPHDHLHQAAPRPSTQLPRGHQGPAAFLAMAAGLATGAVPYTHLDVAASAGAPPASPTAAPLLALAAAHKLLTSC